MSSSLSLARCVCSDEDPSSSYWSIENILQCQKASDFLIALAYFSIPLELLYFVSNSTMFPFRWILLQFGAFIVLCGLTHLVNVWTFEPHSFQLMLTLTVLKFLTALVSCATSITLATLLPQMLRLLVREGLLRIKTRELGREVGLLKRQELARWHVRMLTHEIRRSLDRHHILHTTLVELSGLLSLHNCAVWMPDDLNTSLVLTHELNRSGAGDGSPIPTNDPDVRAVIDEKCAVVLSPKSRLHHWPERGEAAAVRMPLLKASNFKGGTPQLVEASYAVLVLVMPAEGDQNWGQHELEIVEVVADQVAVALSHAMVLEESMMMREKLIGRNMELKRAGQEAVLAGEARLAFRKVVSRQMDGPLRSVSAILSILQQSKNLSGQQQQIVAGIVRGSLVLSSLIEDSLDDSWNSGTGSGRLERLQPRPFNLQLLLKEALGVSGLLCSFKGLSLKFDIPKQVPAFVIGNEKHLLKTVVYMVGNVASHGGKGDVFLRVSEKGGSRGGFESKNLNWKQLEESILLRFEVGRVGSLRDVSSFSALRGGEGTEKANNGEGFTFAVCKKLAQLMQGSISVSYDHQGQQMNMVLTVRLQLKGSLVGLARHRYIGPKNLESLLNGMNILLADGDPFNRSIIIKLLDETGCHLTVVSFWYHCLETLHIRGSEFHLLLIDLSMLEEKDHEFFAAIRRLRSEHWLLVVGMTTKVDKDTRQKCLQNGMDGILGKPVILQEMADELQQIIRKVSEVPSPPLRLT